VLTIPTVGKDSVTYRDLFTNRRFIAGDSVTIGSRDGYALVPAE